MFGSFLLIRTLATLAVTLATVWSFILQTLFVRYKEPYEEKKERLKNNNTKNLILFSLSISADPHYLLGTTPSLPLGTLTGLCFLGGGKEGGRGKE